MVRAGVGVTVLPRLAVDETERELSFLPVADPAAQRRIDILRRAHISPSPAARSFEEAVRRVACEVAGSW
jgi:DNA-binding transcriptional LysR family regulator